MEDFPCLSITPPYGATLARFIRGPLPAPQNLIADLASVTNLDDHPELFSILVRESATNDELFEELVARLPLDQLPLVFDLVASRTAVRDRLLDVDTPLTPDVWPCIASLVVDFAADDPPLIIPPDPSTRARQNDAPTMDDAIITEIAVAEAMQTFDALGHDVMLLALSALARPAADAQSDLLNVLGDAHLDTVATCLAHTAKVRAALAVAVQDCDPMAATAAATAAVGTRTTVLGAGGPVLGGVTISAAGASRKTRAARAAADQDKALATVLAAAGAVAEQARIREEEQAERTHTAQLAAEAADPANLPANFAQIRHLWNGGGDAAAAAAAASENRRILSGEAITLRESVPESATHVQRGHNEWVTIPPPPRFEPPSNFKYVAISQLPGWAAAAFVGIKKLNIIQSTVFDTVFNTSNNILVCAPTGAGKTNVALLAVLREIGVTTGRMARTSLAAPAAAFDGDESDDGDSVVSMRDRAAARRAAASASSEDDNDDTRRSDDDDEGADGYDTDDTSGDEGGPEGRPGRRRGGAADDDDHDHEGSALAMAASSKTRGRGGRRGGKGAAGADGGARGGKGDRRNGGGRGADRDGSDDDDEADVETKGAGPLAAGRSATISCAGPGAAFGRGAAGSAGAGAAAGGAHIGAGLGAHGKVKLEGKVVYVAPMKALATEVQDGFTRRLEAYGLVIREVTGDTDVTRAELDASDVIVTTPEKFDLMTRKPTYETFVRQVTLMLVDEVHFLHDERGAVLEAIVGRLHRLAEQQQRTIRFVAMSATLPNPLDVARFLGVTPNVGLFIFPPNFRPVPLRVEMVGLKPLTSGRSGMRMNDQAADEVAYEKAAAIARGGQSVMVFVHSRKQTVTLMQRFAGLSAKDKRSNYPFSPRHHAGAAAKSAYGGGAAGGAGGMSVKDAERLFEKRRTAIQRISLSELRTSVMEGMACHHAGMVRGDRLLVEQMFREGLLRLIVCTSTLAWGVNLPAHAVIIRGTDVFKSESGSSDLDILDVLQIFGRAGRPQYDDEGEAMLITNTPKLPQYLRIFHDQLPIESRLIKALPDHLNAEVVLGTVNSVDDGMQWLGHSFWFVRAQRLPHHYGLSPADVANDPQLGAMRRKRIHDAGTALDRARMARFDPHSGTLSATELGRIAAHYYVTTDTMNVWSRDETLLACTDLGRCIRLLSNSDEFTGMRTRDDEEECLLELSKHIRYPPAESKSDEGGRGADWKVSILMQYWVDGRADLPSHSLKCELQYVGKQAPRLCAALHQVCLYRGMKTQAILFHQLNLCLEKRMWPNQHPLRQFNRDLPDFIFERLETAKAGISRLLDMSADEVGNLIRNQRQGASVKYLAERIPTFESDVVIAPITPTILRVTLTLLPAWRFDAKYHLPAVSGTIIVGDTESDHVYHTEHVRFEKDDIRGGEPTVLVFNIGALSITSASGAVGCVMPSHYTFTLLIHRWAGVTHKHVYPTRGLVVPQSAMPYTELARIPPLPTAVLPPRLARAFPFPFFNPIQSMIFFTAFQTDRNLLVGAPTGSGKTVAADLAVLRLVTAHPRTKAVYVAPLKSLVRERIDDWTARLGPAGIKLVELTGEAAPDVAAIEAADVIVTVPEKWDGVTRGRELRRYVRQCKLLIFDEVHVLGTERGAILEAILARTRRADERERAAALAAGAAAPLATRVVAMSTAVANATDLSVWLGVQRNDVFNFRPHIRPVPVEVHVRSFPGEHYCPRMETMNGPVFQAIQDHSAAKPTLVFVSSRRQTRLTAFALRQRILSAGRGSFAVPSEQRRTAAAGSGDAVAASRRHGEAQDKALAELLPFGLGIHHAGMSVADRKLVEDGFRNGSIGVLVATSTLAWGVNLPAHLVILKGTEYFDKNTNQYVDYDVTDVLQMMGRAGRPQYDTSAVACIFVHEPKKPFFKKFLYEPFPVESLLHKDVAPHINAEVAAATIANRGGIVDYLTHTYLFRRLPQNPSYYGVPLDGVPEKGDARQQATVEHIGRLVDDVIVALHGYRCITTHRATIDDKSKVPGHLQLRNIGIKPTSLGRIAAYYYLRPQTVAKFDEEISPDVTTADLLLTLCRAAEFAQVPVRHSEDETNEGLAAQIMSVDFGEAASGVDADGELLAPKWDSLGLAPSASDEAPNVFAFGSMGDGNTKALLMLLAHVYHVPFAVPDYYTDQKSVLDNAARIVQALVDIAADKRFLCASIRAMRLAAVVASGRRLDAHPLAFLGASDALLRAVPLAGGLVDVVEDKEELIAKLKKVAGKPGIPQQAAIKVAAAVQQLPIYDIQSAVSIQSITTTDGEAGASTHAAFVDISVHCRGGDPYTPVGAITGKANQSPGGWLIVGDAEADELLALARFTPSRRRRGDGAIGGAKVTFPWDAETFGNGDALRVFFVSDTYIGIDQCLDAPFGDAVAKAGLSVETVES